MCTIRPRGTRLSRAGFAAQGSWNVVLQAGSNRTPNCDSTLVMRRIAILSLIAFSLAAFQAHERTDTVAADPFISADAAHELVGKRGVVFLHVGRTDEGFRQGHIPGAQFLPLSAFVQERDGLPMELPPVDQLQSLFDEYGILDNGRVIIYSDPSLGDIETLAAARAYFTLDVLGHPYVAVLDGGLDAWRAAGYELNDGPSARTASSPEFEDRSNEIIVDADHVAARLNDPQLFLADARPATEYTGETPGTDVERPGHIPGAANLFWKDFVREDGTLKPTEDVAQMWTDAGLTRDDDVVVYCRTGMQASYAYLVARHLGLEPRMYDGSYIDWSNNTDYPVER